VGSEMCIRERYIYIYIYIYIYYVSMHNMEFTHNRNHSIFIFESLT
jgi:hypothetical protein